jgi:hypothetical protein
LKNLDAVEAGLKSVAVLDPGSSRWAFPGWLDEQLDWAFEEDFEPRHPRGLGRAVEVAGHWGQRVLLRERHFEHYSIAVGLDVAYANGLRPGDDLLLPVRGSNDRVTLSWLPTSPNRTVRISGASRLLTALGVEPGDEAVLVPTPHEIVILTTTAELGAAVRQSRMSAEARRAQVPHPGSELASGEPMPQPVGEDPLLDLLRGD